jgi:DNA-binding CsgD family transcriptional regulator
MSDQSNLKASGDANENCEGKKDSLYKNDSWLREQYNAQQKTEDEIAELADVHKNTIRRWMDKYNIERRSPSEAQSEGNIEPLKDSDWLREQYWGKRKTPVEIGDELGLSHKPVWTWLDKHGIETRSAAEAQTEGDIESLKDPDWLREQYWDHGRTLAEIADDLNVTDVTVNKYMKKHGIKRRDTTSPEVQSDGNIEPLKEPEWLTEQYVENELSAGKIAEKLGVSKTPVLRYMHEHGIEPRSIAERNSNGNVEPLRDANWLRRRYVEDELSQYEIAESLGISARTVANWLDRHGIEIRSHGFDPDHLPHRVRSEWELVVANLLCDIGVKYEYESLEIEYGDGRIYTPDFVTDRYVIEVKGHVYSNEIEKAHVAMEHLDERDYVVVGTELPADIHISLENQAALHRLFE